MTKLINISEFEVPQRAGNLVLEEYTKINLEKQTDGTCIIKRE